MTWHIPSGYSNTVYNNLLLVNHLLIAGCSGSGKSVVLNGILREILQTAAPSQKKIIILDPKMVDFAEFNYFKPSHLVRYANKYEDMVDALDYVTGLMMYSYDYMQKNHLKIFDGSDLYLFIDEYADLHDIGGKDVESKVIRICQLARAAKIHVIISTQRAVSCVNTRIRTNLDYRLALHTVNKKESVNIIDVPGAETLPLNGVGIYSTPSGLRKIKLPYVEDSEVVKLLKYWTSSSCKS